MFRSVRDEVMTATKREQQPFIYGSLSKEAIYLKAPAAITPPAPAAGTPSPQEEAARAWAVTKDTTSQAVLEDFIRQFGFKNWLDYQRIQRAARHPTDQPQ